MPTKKVAIIDIWTFKVKTSICELKNNKVYVIWYWEKKCEPEDIKNWEIWNIKWICETIKTSLKKAWESSKTNPKDVIINLPSSQIYEKKVKINFKRENINKEIDKKELEELLINTQNFAIKKSWEIIKQKTWYGINELKLIISNVSKISIDWVETADPIWFSWENTSLTVSNIFCPKSKFNTIKTIWKYLWKNIKAIVPNEYAIASILPEEETKKVLYIDIWNMKTRVAISEHWSSSFSVLNIGLNDLIKQISEHTGKTKNEVMKDIENLDNLTLKENFLEIWEEWIKFSLEEIWEDSFPEKIFLLWWWNRQFVKNYLKKKIWSKISFIDEEFWDKCSCIWEKCDIFISDEIRKQIRLNMLALIKTFYNKEQKKENIVISTFDEVIKKLNRFN